MEDTVTLVREKTLDDGVVIGADGMVIYNALQMDSPLIVRDYSDGMRHLINSITGKLVLAPFDPTAEEPARCPHCQGQLGGDPRGR